MNRRLLLGRQPCYLYTTATKRKQQARLPNERDRSPVDRTFADGLKFYFARFHATTASSTEHGPPLKTGALRKEIFTYSSRNVKRQFQRVSMVFRVDEGARPYKKKRRGLPPPTLIGLPELLSTHD